MPYLSLLTFAIIYLVVRQTLGMSDAVAVLYLVMSVVCYLAYARDRAAARAGTRRTKETVLLLIGVAGGWPGAIVAQQLLRHKVKRNTFRRRFSVTIGINMLLFIVLAALPALREIMAPE